MGMMRRAVAREQEESVYEGTAAEDGGPVCVDAGDRGGVIAAVRLARETEVRRHSARVAAAVMESVGLARMIPEKIVGPV
jgi:hypothetical protein